MKLEEAIEILTESIYLNDFTPDSDFIAAIKLGEEALKRVRDDRGTSYQPVWYPLLGETKDPITLPPTLRIKRR